MPPIIKNKKMRTPTLAQINFCRLTGISHQEYQSFLFESGCEFAENYSQNYYQYLSKEYQKTYIRAMLSLTEYWKWWANQWDIRTQEAFGIAVTDPDEPFIGFQQQEALKEAFYETHEKNSYQNIRPNRLVTKALNQKIDGTKNKKISAIRLKTN